MIADLGNKMQVCTQRYGKRPYGVGLLVAGYDDKGPHIFQTCPSSNYYGKAETFAVMCSSMSRNITAPLPQLIHILALDQSWQGSKYRSKIHTPPEDDIFSLLA
jgi:hypothetical protein